MRALNLTKHLTKYLAIAMLLAAAASAAEQWNRDAVYAERVVTLQATIAARPNDVNALA